MIAEGKHDEFETPMKTGKLKFTAELAVIGTLLVLAVLSVAFIGALVAPPKVLFGRSLTAIPPSLFPLIALSLLALLCGTFIFWRSRNADPDDAASFSIEGWKRGILLFGLMTFYALTMQPFGFLISSAIAMVLISWLAGNRSVWQIVLLSVVGPILLYLTATRLLAVSLPELSVIEFFYARMLGG